MAAGLPRIYGITDPVVEAVVFHGLRAAPPGEVLEADWRPSVPWLVNQRLGGVALDLVKTHSVDLPGEVLDQLRAARRHEQARTLLANLSAARVTTIMRDAEVPFAVVKGPAMAAVDPVPRARPYLDVDIVVEPSRYADAMAAARAAGFESNTERPARKYYERYCYEGVNLRDGDQRSIDIHHHVPPWWAGKRLTVSRLLRDVRTVRIDGVDVPLAAPSSNLFIAALHLVSDQNRPGWKLLSWRDVMSTIAACKPDEVASLAGELHLGWWLRWILEQMPGNDATASILARLPRHAPSRIDLVRVRALVASGEQGRNLAFAARLPIANSAAYVAGQAVPSKAARAAHLNGNKSLVAWWRYVGHSFFHSPSTSDR